MPPWPVGQPRPAELRHEFEAAALAYYRQLDDKPFNATDVIFPFMQAHPGAVSRPTLDRWIKRMVDEGLIRRTWRPERNNNRHHPNREAQLNRKARLNAIRDRHRAARAAKEQKMAELMAPSLPCR